MMGIFHLGYFMVRMEGIGGKDCIWRGDDLWAHRWAQAAHVEPDFIQYIPS